MGERKVLNKYIPPDFDPSKIPRSKNARGAKNGQIKVRMMLPMTICCNTCGEFITKGTKFNARKEDVAGEDYLGIRIFRFYFRCTRCSAELAMKTDPKNSDYVVEAGASRNYEMWKDTTEDDEAKAKALDEAGNEMRALENRTEESKHEMRSLNARHAGISNADALRAMASAAKTEDELYVDLECLFTLSVRFVFDALAYTIRISFSERSPTDQACFSRDAERLNATRRRRAQFSTSNARFS